MLESNRLYQKLKLQVEENPLQAVYAATALLYAVSKFVDVIGFSSHARRNRGRSHSRRR